MRISGWSLVYGAALAVLSYNVVTSIGRSLNFWDTPEEKFAKEILVGAKPITQLKNIQTILANGDTITSQRVDTVAWTIAADKFKFE